MKVHDLTEVNVDAALEETFTTTTILTEKRNAENQPISVSYRVTTPTTVSIIIIVITVNLLWSLVIIILWDLKQIPWKMQKSGFDVFETVPVSVSLYMSDRDRGYFC